MFREKLAEDEVTTGVRWSNTGAVHLLICFLAEIITTIRLLLLLLLPLLLLSLLLQLIIITATIIFISTIKLLHKESIS